MKKLFFGFLILLFAIWIGYLIHQDAGYVLVSYGHWKAETSLWVALLTLALVFLFFYALIRLFKHTASLGGKFERWGTARKSRKSIELTNQGLCDLAEGNWARAETQLLKSAKHSTTPLINYLAAARAAQAQEAYDRRDTYLRKAHHTKKSAEVAISLTQAQLQIESEQWEQALATLKHLHDIAPNHKHALKLLRNVYEELHDWMQLTQLIPTLKKHQIASPDELKALERKAYRHLLRSAAQSQDDHAFRQTWATLPRASRQDPKLLKIFVDYATTQVDADNMLSTLEKALNKNWDAELALAYGKLNAPSETRQLHAAENWLKKYGEEPELLLTLGLLCIREKFWGKAKDYLTTCLQKKNLPEAHRALAHTYEALGDNALALVHYQQI